MYTTSKILFYSFPISERMYNQKQGFSPPKLPPKSRFNDQESTAVLRLLVKQEKLLKNKDENPALKPTPEKCVRTLPPVTPDVNIEETNQKENVVTRQELCHYSHLPAGISSERPTSGGRPNVARTKERPKVSYGRRQQQQKQQKETQKKEHQQILHKQQQRQQQQLHSHNKQHERTEAMLRTQSRRICERGRTHSYEETISNLKEQTLKLGSKMPVSRTQSCPVEYETHVPPIPQNKHSMFFKDSTSSLNNSLGKINLDSAHS